MHLPLDGLQASGLLDHVVDELRRLLVPHLSLTDPSLGEQLGQVRVQVVGIPPDVRDVPDRKEEDRGTQLDTRPLEISIILHHIHTLT